MLPNTHFLIALLIGLFLFKTGNLSLKQSFTIAIISMLIDLDHLFSYYFKHHKFDIKETWNAAVVKHEQEKSFIQHKKGFILVSISLVIILFINLKLSLILGVAYYTHYLLDHIHIKLIHKYKIKRLFNTNIPFNYFEIILNILAILIIIFMF